ncbi:hypothetical protein [Actinomadura fibrosa]|uniref:Uncharacterized protein n=1 Tax=Actinomadura fibrosa TaxID=111802 RepID=A0ABW2XDJ3_9ACTN|nr:hypothetical protein [Actinomadura fibrosa]
MQRPGTPDELLDPAELWARGGTVAAIEAAALVSRDFSGCYSVHADGVTWDDSGGNEWTLSLLDGGRAVLYGCDHEGSWTRFREPELDLLEGAPDWLPLDRLTPMQRGAELGFVYWYDGVWHRVDYPADVKDDGLGSTVGEIVDMEELADYVAYYLVGDEWGGGGREEVGEVLEGMIRQARDRALSAQSFAWLSDGMEPDVAAALDVAAAARLTGGAGSAG